MAIIEIALDKATDICRDYLVAPTAVSIAPAQTVLPHEVFTAVWAGGFVILILGVKGYHKHYKEVHQMTVTQTHVIRHRTTTSGRHSAKTR